MKDAARTPETLLHGSFRHRDAARFPEGKCAFRMAPLKHCSSQPPAHLPEVQGPASFASTASRAGVQPGAAPG
eukprot:scaffold61458_cov17-Tisochrysis_lutea.AAC.1